MKPTKIKPIAEQPINDTTVLVQGIQASPVIDQTVGDSSKKFAGWSEGCNCGRIHEKWINPETGKVSIDTGWY